MEAAFKWVVRNLCFMEHLDHYIFLEWNDGLGGEKGTGLKKMDLTLPGRFFRDVENGLELGTMPVNQVDKKACAKGPFSEKQKSSTLKCSVSACCLCCEHTAELWASSMTGTHRPGLPLKSAGSEAKVRILLC